MGFLKNLFTPKKEICEVIVFFYSSSEASVTFFKNGVQCNNKEITNAGLLDRDMVLLFLLYYGRILFNLGKSDAAFSLIKKLKVMISDIFDMESKTIKRIPVVGNYGLQHFKLMCPENVKGKRYKKFYAGTLLQRADGVKLLTLNYARGEEEFYAPASVFLLLQWLMDSAADKFLTWCIIGLYMVNEYFLKVGSHTDIDNVMGAAHGAVSEMTNMEKELEKVKVW